MGKRGADKAERAKKEAKAPSGMSLLAQKKALDPALASLFSHSLGPVKAPERSYPAPIRKEEPQEESDAEENEDEESDNAEVSEESAEEEEASEEESDAVAEAERARGNESLLIGADARSQRKRKRKNDEEELEDKYMNKLAREEAKEEAERQAIRASKRVKEANEDDDSAASGSEQDDEEEEDEKSGDEAVAADGSDAESLTIPQHESLVPQKGSDELDKASRTIFLGNVSNEAIDSKSKKKELIYHLESFISSLPAHNPPHKVESLRFRSTAFASSIPKKAAFAKKELMDATTKSTNAYAVYTTQIAAREAAKRLNGTVVLGRHLRVDEVAHPAKIDHRRCVFVGNLDFVDDESLIQEAEAKDGKKRKSHPPADVEEGLWQQMSKAGTVESVRVVRDSKTRVGKGFAYVQFTDENGVEAALQFNDKKFPPLLPRKLRVVRAKAIKRNAEKHKNNPTTRVGTGIYKPKASAEEKSALGRASKLLGRAGAAKARSGTGFAKSSAKRAGSKAAGPGPAGFKAPEAFIFEGHRASSKQGNSGLKFGGKGGKKSGKPKSRSARRGAAWKAGK